MTVGDGDEARPHPWQVLSAPGGAPVRALGSVLSFLLLACVSFVFARPVSGQAGQDTTKSRTELIRDRIRTISPLIKHPDSLAADSARADSLARAAERGMPLAPVQGLSGAARDSVMEELLRLTGYAVTEYKSETARFEADSGRLDLRIGAEVVRDRQRLAADSGIVFLQESSVACAYGLPTLSGEGAPVRADSLCYNADTKRGIAWGATTEITEGATWITHSETSFTVDETVYSHGGIFTDCELAEPHYHFGAGELKVVRGDIMVARNVTFNFRDVPVFWLPFFVQSMKRGRRSGILFPRFGINDIARNSTSYKRRVEDVGFYWAINDYLGAEMALDWQADNFTSLRGTFDFRHLRKFVAGSVTYRNYWRAEGGTEFSLASQTNWQPDERTRLNGNVSYVTSTRFVQQNSIDPRELNRSIDSRMGFNRRFDFGSLNLSGSRSQFLSDNTVNMTLPTLGFSLNSITLFPALPGESSWYNNATWTGSFNSNVRSRTIDTEKTANPGAQSNREVTAKMSSNFQMGKFSWNQDFDYTDQRDLERMFEDDSIETLPERYKKRITWSTGLNFQQRLMGNTTFTPGLRMRGEMMEADTTGGERVAAPTRIDVNAALRTDLFAFIGGFGPIERIRHRISPGFTWSYSPSPTITERQREVFNVREVREQNRLTISLSQTFEAKMKDQPGSQSQPGGVPADTTGAAADSLLLSADTTLASDTATGPRRRQTAQPITILSITTDAMVYDFVEAREEGEGFQTAELGHSIQSDFLRGLQISFAHNLFEQVATDTLGGTERRFKPFLSRVTASFSLGSSSWLARVLRIGPRSPDPQAQREQQPQEFADTSMGPQVQRSGAEFGLLGAGRSTQPMQRGPAGAAGTWNASFNYTMSRQREGTSENQMLTANVSFQPTMNWSLRWNTGYSFTESEFTDHILTLTRTLHDWDANFDFVKAQNGNFSFQFRVSLRANPDIKMDYEQRELRRFSPSEIR